MHFQFVYFFLSAQPYSINFGVFHFSRLGNCWCWRKSLPV